MFKNFVMSLKKSLLLNYKIVFLSIILSFISFPAFNLSYGPGIDGPLAWVFNFFADGHFQVGKDLLFPHGPLAFLLYPLPVGNNLTAAILITLSISVLLSLSVYKIYFIKKQENYLVPTLLLLILQASLDLQLQIIALSLSQFVLFDIKGTRKHLILALFFCVFNLYIKSYGGVICMLLSGSVLISQLYFRKNYSILFPFALYSFGFFYLFWIGLYQSIGGAFTFLRGQFELATDNSEAVSFYQVNNWWWISVCFLSVIALFFFLKDKQARSAYGWMLLPLFGAWKHAMSRGDEPHVSGFLSFLFLFCFMIWLLSEEHKVAVLFLGILILSAFTLNMSTTSQYNDYSKQKDIALFKPFNLYNLLCHGDSISKEKNKYSQILNANEKLPDTLLHLLHNKTTDVFPWNHSLISMNHLRWVTRPTLHSYASYTSWLDEQNADFYSSEKSAEYVIWQIDQLGGALYSIDSRYLLNDAPKAIIRFFSLYDLCYRDTKFLVYQKNEKALLPVHKTISASKKIKFNTWVNVPEYSKDGITRAKLGISKSLLGLLKSALYKGESFSIYYELSNGKTFTHKIVPKNAEDGLWINPLLLLPEGNFTEAAVKKIKIKCWDDKMVTGDFSLEFEEIHFQSENGFLYRCFGKADSTKHP